MFVSGLLGKGLRLYGRRFVFFFHGLETLSRLSRFYRDSDSVDHSSRRIDLQAVRGSLSAASSASVIRAHQGIYANKRGSTVPYFLATRYARRTLYTSIFSQWSFAFLPDQTNRTIHFKAFYVSSSYSEFYGNSYFYIFITLSSCYYYKNGECFKSDRPWPQGFPRIFVTRW